MRHGALIWIRAIFARFQRRRKKKFGGHKFKGDSDREVFSDAKGDKRGRGMS